MRIGFSLYKLDPFEAARRLVPRASVFELLVPSDGMESAGRIRRHVLDPGDIEAVLTVLCLPDRVVFDAEGKAVAEQRMSLAKTCSY